MRRFPRPLALAAALLIGLVVAAVLVLRARDDAPPETGRVALVGDSLNVGTLDYLGGALPGWTVRSDSVVGRVTDDGLVALERLGGREPVVISLGTNDPPEAVGAFQEDVDRALRLAGEGRCVIWATIWRSDGPDDGYNDVLERAADEGRLRLLRWDEMLARDPSLLAPDGIHGSPDGYRARAEEAARLVRSCPRTTDAQQGGAAG
jgi:hypothetical protein